MNELTVACRLLEGYKKVLGIVDRISFAYMSSIEADRTQQIRNILKTEISWAESELAKVTPKQLPTQEYIDSAKAAHVYMSHDCPFDDEADYKVYEDLSKAIVFAEHERDNATPKLLEYEIGTKGSDGYLSISLQGFKFEAPFVMFSEQDIKDTKELANDIAKSLGLTARMVEK